MFLKHFTSESVCIIGGLCGKESVRNGKQLHCLLSSKNPSSIRTLYNVLVVESTRGAYKIVQSSQRHIQQVGNTRGDVKYDSGKIRKK